MKNDIKQSALFYLIGKRLTIKELADIFSVTTEQISVWLEELDINTLDVVESAKNKLGYCLNCQAALFDEDSCYCSSECLESLFNRRIELDKIKRTKIIPTTAHRFLYYDARGDRVLIKRNK